MKRQYLYSLLFLTGLSITACFDDDDDNDPQIVGSGNVITETRNLDDFDKVTITGVFNVDIAQGDPQRILIEADDNIMERIITKVNQNTLNVDLEDGNYANGFTANVSLRIPELILVNNLGVSNVTITSLTGVEELEVINTGVGSNTLNGSGLRLSLTNTGTGLLTAFAFITDSCTVNQAGVGDIEVTCNDHLTGTLTGVGNILYRGQPSIDIVISGVGAVIDAN